MALNLCDRNPDNLLDNFGAFTTDVVYERMHEMLDRHNAVRVYVRVKAPHHIAKDWTQRLCRRQFKCLGTLLLIDGQYYEVVWLFPCYDSRVGDAWEIEAERLSEDALHGSPRFEIPEVFSRRQENDEWKIQIKSGNLMG